MQGIKDALVARDEMARLDLRFQKAREREQKSQQWQVSHSDGHVVSLNPRETVLTAHPGHP